MLQPRFEDRSRKRVFRLLAHPRFRAAYDFLLLRAPEGEHIKMLGDWWTRAQTLAHEALAEELDVPNAPAKPAASAAEGVPASKRARRRRRRKPNAANPASQ